MHVFSGDCSVFIMPERLRLRTQLAVLISTFGKYGRDELREWGEQGGVGVFDRLIESIE